jgi:adenosylhomocysteine nucleosidase
MKIVAICGFAAEARILRRHGIEARISGADPARATFEAEAAIAGGAKALMSFGVAGGLDPKLRTGDLLLPLVVAALSGERFAVDAALHGSLHAAFAGTNHADLLGLDSIGMDSGGKARLHAHGGAVAVDMESLGVARVAKAHGCPFIVLRAVADEASRSLPPAALVGLDTNGRFAPYRVMASLFGRPGQLPALIGLARDTRRALASLHAAPAAIKGIA